MNWYYARGQEQIGPLNEAAFQAAVAVGDIGPDTLVWNETLPNWQRYAEVAPAPAGDGGQHCACLECGNLFLSDNMVPYGGGWVCAACKPIFFQRLKEGAALPGTFNYAGFWIRFVAKFIDGLIAGIASYAIGMAVAFLLPPGDATTGFIAGMLQWVIGVALGAAYTTYFIGTFAATPGKMACGLKVIRSDGSPVSYLRAFARNFAEMLSGIILYIGYIMAAFDDEKRTLHDRICDTRVVRK